MKKIINLLVNLLLTISIIIATFMIIFNLSFTSIVVTGNSMNPGISDANYGYMVKVNAKTNIERFDVVAVNDPTKTADYHLIKRIVGLPGETISIVSNVLTVNGEVVEQTFDFVSRTKEFDKATSWILGDNEYLIAGDNRPVSVEPMVVTKDMIFGKNGFCVGSYDLSTCVANNYKRCKKISKEWYLFKDGNC